MLTLGVLIWKLDTHGETKTERERKLYKTFPHLANPDKVSKTYSKGKGVLLCAKSFERVS